MPYTRVSERTWLRAPRANCHSAGPFYISLGGELKRVAHTLIFTYAPHSAGGGERAHTYRTMNAPAKPLPNSQLT
jgi:hypothetical protein